MYKGMKRMLKLTRKELLILNCIKIRQQREKKEKLIKRKKYQRRQSDLSSLQVAEIKTVILMIARCITEREGERERRKLVLIIVL